MKSPLDRDYTSSTGDVDLGLVAGSNRGKRMPSGMHHLALFTSDMKKTVEFYERVLGMRMRAIFEMHGVPGAKHCFLEAGSGFEISFVQIDDPRTKPAVLGSDIPHNMQTSLDDEKQMPGGTLAHIAFRCKDVAELKALRKQVKDAGVMISPILDHGLCYSAYFQDPNGFQLEISTTIRPYDQASEVKPELLDRTLSAKDDKGMIPLPAKL